MKKIRIGEIYKHTNKITGDAYVGKTVKGRGVRWTAHVFAAYAGASGHFYNAIRKYGPENFRHRTLKRVTEPLLSAAEIFFIAKHDTFKHGYNMTRGGDGWDGTPAAHRRQGRALHRFYEEHPEALVALSNRALAFYATPAGVRCAAKIAKSLTGFKPNKRARRNMAAALVRRYEKEAARTQTSKAGKRHARSAAGKVSYKARGEKVHQTYLKKGGHSLATRKLLSDKAKVQWAEKRDIMMTAMSLRDYTVSLKTRRQISETLKKTYAEHPELMAEHVKRMTGRKASEETKMLQSVGIQAAWEAKTNAQKALVGYHRSVGVTAYYDRIGRKAKAPYKRSDEARANMSIGATKRWQKAKSL